MSCLLIFTTVLILFSIDDTFARRGGHYGGTRGYNGGGSIRHSSYGRPYQSRPYESRPYQSRSYQSGYGSTSSRQYLERNQNIAEFAGGSRRNRSYSNNSIREEAYEDVGDDYQDRRDYRRDVYHDWPSYYNYGYVVPILPVDYKTLDSAGTTYYYSSGVYYLPRDDKYVVVAPPSGAAIRALSPGYTTINVGNIPYYYYQGTYYVSDYSGYVVTEPQAGLTVDYVPDGYKSEVNGGVKYYVYNDVTYRPYYRDGKLVYIVVKL